jgi:hypothetical protein
MFTMVQRCWSILQMLSNCHSMVHNLRAPLVIARDIRKPPVTEKLELRDRFRFKSLFITLYAF